MPNFIDRIAAEYQAGVAHVFLLHFNVWDIAYDEMYGYLPMTYYLMEQLNVLGLDLILGYSPTMGFHWPNTEGVKQNVMHHLGLAPHRDEIWDADVAREHLIGRIDDRGVFTAQHVGRGRVQVQVGDVVAQTDPISVSAPALTDIQIHPHEATIPSGKQRRFVAVGRDPEGREVYLEHAKWEVIVERLFRLDASLQNELKTGPVSRNLQQQFQRNKHPLSDRATVSVEREGEIWRITDVEQTYTIRRKENQLDVQVGEIGQIDSNGVLRATKTGKGRLRVRAGNQVNESGNITVVPGELVSLEIEPTRFAAEPGKSVEFRVRGRDAENNEIQPRGTTWDVVPLRSEQKVRRRINTGIRTDKWWEDETFKWKQPGDVRSRFNQLVRSGNAKVGLVIDFIEEMTPSGEISHLTADQRYYIEDIQRWAMDLDIRLKRNIVLMLARNIKEVSPALTMNGDIPVVEVPFPNHQERLALIQHLLSLPLQERPPDRSQIVTRIRLANGFSPEQFATSSAGLNLLGIHDVALRAEQFDQPITPELVEQYKRESMRVHSRGLLDVVNTEFGIEYVGGMQHVGNYLRQIVQALHDRETKIVPTGILFLGPPGTGKTFIAQVLAKQGGMAFVQLKNTQEGILDLQASAPGMEEKVYVENITMALSYVRALAPVVVFMDDIDHTAGMRSEFDARRTDSNLPMDLTNFISDTSNRGNILWIGASNRPDRIDPLFRRRGLFDDRLIFLLPTAAERADILQKLFRKHRISIAGNVNFTRLTRDELAKDLSGGDLEVIVQRSFRIARRHQRDRVSEEDLLHAIRDFTPEYTPDMLEFMSLLAMQEATSREMLPVHLPPGLNEYIENSRLNKKKIQNSLRKLRKNLNA